MYNKTARDRVVRRTAESAAGLIQLAQQRKTVALDIEHAAKRHAICAGAIERYVPPLSCYRSVSKRSLSTPTTFLSTHQRLDWGGSFLTFTSALFELLHGDDGAGVPFGALALAQLPPQPDTLRFLDTNSPDRARIENMVLIGMRAKVAVDLTFEETGLSSFNEEYNAGAAADTIENYVRDYVALAAYYSADSLVATDTVTPDAAAPASPNVYRRPAEPWFDFTPLRYFDHDDGAFLPVPPLLFAGRDTHCKIGVRKGEHGPGTNPLYNTQRVPVASSQPTTTGNIFINAYAQLSILVEALFVPSPEECGDYWPGELCPVHKVGNHPKYNPGLPVFSSVQADDVAHTVECTTCGCDRPTPTTPSKKSKWGILDPRHNLKEAAKQLLLLEDHLFNDEQWCPDCAHKHCLMIEALGDEGVSLDKGGTDAGQWCKDAARHGASTWSSLQAGRTVEEDGSSTYPLELRQGVADKLRTFRKSLTKRLRAPDWA